MSDDDVRRLMKRCQVGVGGRNALNEAHSIMAECYGTLGRLMMERDAARALLREAREWAPTKGHSFDDPRWGGVDLAICEVCSGVDDGHHPDCAVARIDALLGDASAAD